MILSTLGRNLVDDDIGGRTANDSTCCSAYFAEVRLRPQFLKSEA